MADAVLDSSVALAFLQGEAGAEKAGAAMAGGLMSVVNLAEVVAKLVNDGVPHEDALQAVRLLPFETVDADAALAHRAGALRAQTKHLGISLGDRFCLALAEREGLPAVTGDRAWASLRIGVKIVLFR